MKPAPRSRRTAARRSHRAGDAARAGPGDNGAMDIELNGRATEVAAGTSVQALLEAQGLGARRVAVEVNGEIVPRGQHASRELQPGDRIEIVHALGGG